MTIKYKEILPGVFLRGIETDKFKNTCFSVNFLDRLSEENAAQNALIPRVLCRGSKTLPDMQKLAEVTDSLYGARIEPIVRKFGDVQAFGVVCDFIDGRYTAVGDELLNKCIELTEEILFNPLVYDNGFSAEYTESEAENLKDEIKSEMNDKLPYAYRQTIKNMYPKSGFGLNELGLFERVGDVTPGGLYKRYREIIEKAPVELFFCGNASFDEVENVVLKAFENMKKRKWVPVSVSTLDNNLEYREYTEKMDMDQAVLLLGSTASITYQSEDFYSMRVFSSVLGGGTSSKLFLNVREKKSLCYYTGTKYDRFSGSMVLYCGVAPEKIDSARAEMINQLTSTARGDIEESELNNAKRSILNQLKIINDSPYAMENYWLNEAVSGTDTSPEDAAHKIKGISIEDVVKAANKCKLVLTYLLNGKEDIVNERKYIQGN